MKKFFQSITFVTGAFLCILFIFGTIISSSLPDNLRMTPESSNDIKNYLHISPIPITAIKPVSQTDQIFSSDTYKANVLLMNAIPIKRVNIQNIEDIYVIPCGNPFGVKLFTKGVIIVGISDIKTANGLYNPAKQAGLQKGDIILSIGNKEISSNEELIKIVEKSDGKSLKAEIIRNGMRYETQLQPIQSDNESTYKLGIWVRDSSAGIGTITFWDEKSGIFAGLGHGICDIDTGELLPLSHGDIIKANINGISKGIKGSPGELRGYFIESKSIGTLTENTYSGVYGKLEERPIDKEPIRVAMKQQVKVGKAQILTTIFGMTPGYYDVDIMHIDYNEKSPSKNMIIKITDSNLLKQTGGIIQGMSGSPIIQNGMLIGAVTHVFVNDPQKGYAIFAENMISKLQDQKDIDYKKVS